MMDLRSQMKVVDLLLKLFRGDLQHINPYPFVPQKHKNIKPHNARLSHDPSEEAKLLLAITTQAYMFFINVISKAPL